MKFYRSIDKNLREVEHTLLHRQVSQGRRQPPKYGVDKQAKRRKIWGLGAGPQKIFLGPRPLECRKTPFRVPRNTLFWIK